MNPVVTDHTSEPDSQALVIDLHPASLVLLVGPSGSGKSTFARLHFRGSEILSSDACREMVADDPTAQAASEDAFALLHTWLDIRLKRRRFTVVDSTALKPSARDSLLAVAAARSAPVTALLLDVPLEECLRRAAERVERHVPETAIRRHFAQFEQARREIPRDKRFAAVHILSAEDINRVRLVRGASLSASARKFDVIGDVHGCWVELGDLFAALGYQWTSADGLPRHPDGRIPVFVGDLADRGPSSVAVLKLVAHLVAMGLAIFVPGNHDDKLFRLLAGRNVTRSHGLDITADEIAALPPADRAALEADILAHLASAPSYVVLDDGGLVVAHAGIREEMIGASTPTGPVSGRVREFTLYGDVRGFEPGTNRPIRYDWAQEYRGVPLVAYGHTPQEEVRFVGNTINLDGGCVFGGALCALRYPEREILRVRARAVYAHHEGLSYSTPIGDGA